MRIRSKFLSSMAQVKAEGEIMARKSTPEEIAAAIEEFLPLLRESGIDRMRVNGERNPLHVRSVDLRGTILIALENEDYPVELLERVITFFLDKEEEVRGKRTYMDTLFDSENIAVNSLTHPSCPSELLSRACYSSNLHYARLASQHISCPDSDAVYAQLIISEPYADYIAWGTALAKEMDKYPGGGFAV